MVPKKKVRKSEGFGLSQFFNRIDMYGTQLNFTINDNKKTVTTAFGGTVTIIFVFVALLFVTREFIVM